MERAREKGMVLVFNPSPMDDKISTYPWNMWIIPVE